MEALELLVAELLGHRGRLPGDALQQLVEVPALGQGDGPSAPPAHLDARLGRRLLADRGYKPFIFDLGLRADDHENNNNNNNNGLVTLNGPIGSVQSASFGVWDRDVGLD